MAHKGRRDSEYKNGSATERPKRLAQIGGVGVGGGRTGRARRSWVSAETHGRGPRPGGTEHGPLPPWPRLPARPLPGGHGHYLRQLHHHVGEDVEEADHGVPQPAVRQALLVPRARALRGRVGIKRESGPRAPVSRCPPPASLGRGEQLPLGAASPARTGPAPSPGGPRGGKTGSTAQCWGGLGPYLDVLGEAVEDLLGHGHGLGEVALTLLVDDVLAGVVPVEVTDGLLGGRKGVGGQCPAWEQGPWGSSWLVKVMGAGVGEGLGGSGPHEVGYGAGVGGSLSQAVRSGTGGSGAHGMGRGL